MQIIFYEIDAQFLQLEQNRFDRLLHKKEEQLVNQLGGGQILPSLYYWHPQIFHSRHPCFNTKAVEGQGTI